MLAALTSGIAYAESMLQPPYTDPQYLASSLFVLAVGNNLFGIFGEMPSLVSLENPEKDPTRPAA